MPRRAPCDLRDFRAADGAVIDQGLALFFPAPHSYTGEDVLELQGHGGPVVMQQLLRRCVELGARMAQPGEFTRRAFLNERLDLAQAESVADLIDASSVEAARSAARSLAGDFSRRIHALVDALVELRMHVEACIDFPEEEIDPADRRAQARKLGAIRAQLDALLAEARQGAVLREGLTVVLIGRPNVGKSSLLNRLAGDDVAIVTPIAGTTRDYVRATVSLEGVPIHLIDTAGLRVAGDEIERIGIERTWRAVEAAGAALFITEGHAESASRRSKRTSTGCRTTCPSRASSTRSIFRGRPLGQDISTAFRYCAFQRRPARVSMRCATGCSIRRDGSRTARAFSWPGSGIWSRSRRPGAFASSRRNAQAFELMAEELRLAQQALGRITGAISSDDLLGAIFSRFCIGK